MRDGELLDALVVGAGFSGLTAARRLAAAGQSVRVLEARDVVGGRVRAARLAARTVDVGGQWVGAGHERLVALAGEAGATLVAQYDQGKHLLQIGDRLRRFSGVIPPASPLALAETALAMQRIEWLKRGVRADAPWQHARAERLDALTLDQWRRRWVRSAGARALFDAAARAIFCVEPAQISMLGFLQYLRANRSLDYLVGTTGGAQAFIVDGGMQQLARWLADTLGEVVQTGAEVVAITQQDDRVSVRLSDGRGYHARRLIMALAPSATAAMTITPACAERIQLAQGLPMGSVIKCVIAYPRAFWREAGLSGELVSNRSPLSPVFDASPADESMGVLAGFVAGRLATQYSGDDTARRDAVLAGLANAFGPAAAKPLDYVDYDWTTAPYSHGCYVGVPTPGTLSRLGPAFRRPTGRIHWAGTETATEWTGYIEGALESGERAAAEVDAALRTAH
ncbi:amine oxidase [Salinisphaera sp. S4-8]|uniref:flavin monoamine oxidase family protein n=1 Tax=Salinisphaera sp. S4-8 TaxID=633357 RepID=UPI003341C72F